MGLVYIYLDLALIYGNVGKHASPMEHKEFCWRCGYVPGFPV